MPAIALLCEQPLPCKYGVPMIAYGCLPGTQVRIAATFPDPQPGPEQRIRGGSNPTSAWEQGRAVQENRQPGPCGLVDHTAAHVGDILFNAPTSPVALASAVRIRWVPRSQPNSPRILSACMRKKRELRPTPLPDKSPCLWIEYWVFLDVIASQQVYIASRYFGVVSASLFLLRG